MHLGESRGYAPTKSILEDSCMSWLSFGFRVTKAQCLKVGRHFKGFGKPLEGVCKSHRNAHLAQMRKVSYISKLTGICRDGIPETCRSQVRLHSVVPSQPPLERLGCISQPGCYDLTGPIRRNRPIKENAGEYACSRKRA